MNDTWKKKLEEHKANCFEEVKVRLRPGKYDEIKEEHS